MLLCFFNPKKKKREKKGNVKMFIEKMKIYSLNKFLPQT